MKYCLFFLFCISLSGIAQTVSQPYGYEYQFQPGECISEQQRTAIQATLDSSRTQLIAQGRLSAANTQQLVSFAWPLRFRAGINEYDFFSISGGVDHNQQFPNQLLDYNCGSRTYDTQSGYNHAGTDYFLWPFSFNKMDSSEVEVIAAAAGTIIYKSDGNYDRNCTFNSNNWNAVYVQHSDGSVAWYGHLKNGSLTATAVGQTVAQGEYLGVVGSSGNSTGPHLHFEVYDAANNLIDPYAGPCNNMNSASWWSAQRPYIDAAVNHIATNDSLPVFNACPGADVRNERNYFLSSDVIFLMLYYRFLSTGDVATYTIYRPNNSVWGTWQFTHTGPDYQAAWFYYWIIPGLGAPNGQWKYEITYNNQTYFTYFYLGTTGANELVSGASPQIVFNAEQQALQVNTAQQGTLFLYDIAGNLIAEKTINNSEAMISCADLAKGVYLYRFTATNGIPVAGKILIGAQ
ncbi:MAG: peptidoglycan DD-metalloendopeptidase family protein [Bacteroidia bacterium]